jgi:hypothetical protein
MALMHSTWYGKRTIYFPDYFENATGIHKAQFDQLLVHELVHWEQADSLLYGIKRYWSECFRLDSEAEAYAHQYVHLEQSGRKAMHDIFNTFTTYLEQRYKLRMPREEVAYALAKAINKLTHHGFRGQRAP